MVVPYWKWTIVLHPLGLTVPFSVVLLLVTLLAAIVVTVGAAEGVAVGVAVAVAVGVTVGVGVGDDSTHAMRFASTLDNEPIPAVYPPTIIGICPPTTLTVTASANDREVFSEGP